MPTSAVPCTKRSSDGYWTRRVLDKGPFVILYYPLLQANARGVVEGLELAPMESFTEFWGVYKTG